MTMVFRRLVRLVSYITILPINKIVRRYTLVANFLVLMVFVVLLL